MGKYADLLLTGGGDQSLESMTPDARAAYERMMRGRPKRVDPAPAPAKRYSDDILGGTTPEPTASPPAAKQEGWGEWIKNSVKGRQDPREAQTSTVYDQFTDQLRSPTATAAMLGTNDEGMADIISKELGPNFIRRETDANGYPIIVSRGQNGQEQRGYVNKPGLDTQDAWRTFYGAAPYVVGGGVAGNALKGAGLGVNAVAQGLTAGGIKLGGDVGALAVGSEQAPNLMDTAVAAGFGAAGPPVGAAAGALWRRFVTIPGLVNRETGELTAKGLEAARKAGLDPNEITPDMAKKFAENFAKSRDPEAAAVRAGAQRYGIPATQGQITKRPYLLTQEEAMRRGMYGDKAETEMLGFDKRQAEALRSAALGPSGPGAAKTANVAGMIAPERAAGMLPEERMSSTLGESIQDTAMGAREAARKAEGEAWQSATQLESTPEALAELPKVLNSKLSGMIINERATPAAAAMAKEVERIISGEAPEKAASWLSASPTKNVDQMRRNLLSLMKSADNGADKTMASQVYDGFNEWIGNMAEQGMLKGDPESAMRLVKARGFTREVREIFEPKDDSGLLSAGGKRLAAVLDPGKADSGEGVIRALIGTNGSQGINNGTVGALTNLKMALERFAPEQAAQAWGDVGLAYWSRLVTGKNGEMLGAQAIVNNIKNAFQGQSSVMKVLYTPRQQVEIKQFMQAVERIAYKPPNASGSGYTAASLIKDGVMKLLETFGVSKAVTAGAQYTGAANAWNASTARQAVSQRVRPYRPNAAPITNTIGQAYIQNQSGR